MPYERVGELIGIFVLSLITAFFAFNQYLNTGFFTSAFGPLEIFLFYVPVPIAVVVGVDRTIVGRRNQARPLEALGRGEAEQGSSLFRRMFSPGLTRPLGRLAFWEVYTRGVVSQK